MLTLLSAHTTSSSGTAQEFRGDPGSGASKRGGLVTEAWLEASGTFNGATLTLETSSDEGVTWINHTDTAQTAAGALAIFLPTRGLLVRGKVTSAGGSTSVTLKLF
jgi:hypothetical protein